MEESEDSWHSEMQLVEIPNEHHNWIGSLILLLTRGILDDSQKVRRVLFSCSDLRQGYPDARSKGGIASAATTGHIGDCDCLVQFFGRSDHQRRGLAAKVLLI